MSRGILLVAMGHSVYGDMAFNLALSIRHSDKTIPIHLAWAAGAIGNLDQGQKKVFSSMSEVPLEVYNSGSSSNYIRTKLFLYDLSPFDQTIFMDVDMIMFEKPISKLFDQLSNVDFTITNEGFLIEESEVVNEKYSFWADPNTIRVAYMDYPGFEEGKLYMCRSEFIYFTKSEKNKMFFELAKDIYDNPRIDVSTFANHLPDEFAFNIAGRILHQYPHQDNFSPIYWEYLHSPKKRKTVSPQYNDCYGYSIGGNRRDDKERDVYNSHVRYYCAQAGRVPTFLLTKSNDKKFLLPERVNL